jgi:type III pantothenate kinase
MLLAVDAGNSSVSFAAFRGDEVVGRFHVSHAADPATVEELRERLKSVGIAPSEISAVALASVGPHLTDLQRALGQLSHAPVFTLEVDPDLGMPIAYPNPKELGVDRWLNAIAAFDSIRAAVIVVDIGTATNFECVSAAGEFLGGAICVGPQLSLDALSQRSAKLAHLRFEAPGRPLANNTRQALLSGAYYGHAALVDGMVEQLSAEISTPVTVIGTGGYISRFAPICKSLHVIDENLTLKGARLAWERRRVRD